MEIELDLPFDAPAPAPGPTATRPQARVLYGDAIDILETLGDGVIQTVVTSPPYYNLRDYLVPPRQWANGEVCPLGRETSVQSYVDHLVEFYAHLKRVLAPRGSFFLNIADCYAGGGKHVEPRKYASADHAKPVRGRVQGLSKKCLLMVPEQVALGLRADGWIVRQKNVWHKPNAMCESTRDRTTWAYEMVYHLVLQDKYDWYPDAIAEPLATSSVKRYQRVLDTHEQYDPTRHKHGPQGTQRSPMDVLTRGAAGVLRRGTRNARNVWRIPTQPFSGQHFACFPEKLVALCVNASSQPGQLVCDPCSGSGRAGLAAVKLGRNFLGIDVNPEYCSMAQQALREAGADGH